MTADPGQLCRDLHRAHRDQVGFLEALDAVSDELTRLRAEAAAADAMLVKAVHEIDRVDALRVGDLSHEDAWAIVATILEAHPKAKTPASIYEYLRSIRADPGEGMGLHDSESWQ